LDKPLVLDIDDGVGDRSGLLVGVSWSRTLRLLDLLNKHDLSVLVIILVGALESTIRDDGDDPKHPEEDADTASKNERDGPTLPRSKGSQSDVDAPQERGVLVTTMAVAMVAVMMMGVVMMRVVMRVTVGSLINRLVGHKGRGPNGQDMNEAWWGLMYFGHLNDGETKGLAEGVGELDCFHLESGSRSFARGSDFIVTVGVVGPDHSGNMDSRDCETVSEASESFIWTIDNLHADRACADLNKCGASS